MEVTAEYINLQPLRAMFFHADKTCDQKLMIMADHYAYDDQGVKYVCPICNSVVNIKSFSLATGESNCPCCGINLWWGY